VRINCNNEGMQSLYNTVAMYYAAKKQNAVIYEKNLPLKDEKSDIFVRFLVYRRHIVECRIGWDRSLLAATSLAIGPGFFSPAEFWDYENSLRFTVEPTTEGVEKNLRLMDEFFEQSSSMR
jgi:hypothetical protein